MLKCVIISSTAAGGIALIELGMALTPGPNMMYLVSRSVSQGRVAGLVSLVGTAVGFVAVPWLYIGFKAAGAAYLAFLAWQALRPGGHGLFEQRNLQRDSHWKLLRMGLVTNLLNPKVAILYLALIPQFIDPTRRHTTAQGFALGAVQIAVGLTVNALIVLAAGSIAGLLKNRPSWTKWQRLTTGSLLGAVAIVLAREVPARARA